MSKPGERLLIEGAAFKDVRIDKEKGVIHDVKIMNRSSAHNRDYSDQAMNDVVRLTENSHVFDQHSEQHSGVRPIRDQLGMLRNTRRMAESVIGDLHVSARESWLLEDAERMPDSLMMSINAHGKLTRVSGRSRLLVESINRLDSVDVVPLGGTTKSLFEGGHNYTEEEEDEMDWKDMTLAQIREARPDLLDEHKTSVSKVLESESKTGKELLTAQQALKELKETGAEQKKKLDEYAVKEAIAQKKTKIEELLKESKLPEEALTEGFQSLLSELPDEKAIKAAIEDRAKLVETASAAPINRPRGGYSAEGMPDEKALIEALEG